MSWNNINIFGRKRILVIAFIINLSCIITSLFAGIITVENTNVPEKAILPGAINVPVMAFKIIDSASHAITNIKIKNLGDMSNSIDVVNLKLWYDVGSMNGIWDAGDVFITNAAWNAGNNSWDFVGLGSAGISNAIDLSGWDIVIDGNLNYTIPANTILSNDKYLIISRFSTLFNFKDNFGVSNMPAGCLFLDNGSFPDMDGTNDIFLIRDSNDVAQDGPAINFNAALFTYLDNFDEDMPFGNDWGFSAGGCNSNTLSQVLGEITCPPDCWLRIDWTNSMGCWESWLDIEFGSGTDISMYSNLSITIAASNEGVEIWLRDASNNWDVFVLTNLLIMATNINIPLTNFPSIDLTAARSLEIHSMCSNTNGCTIFVYQINFNTGPRGYRQQRNDPELDPSLSISWSKGITPWSGVESQDATNSGVIISEIHLVTEDMNGPELIFDFIEIYNDFAVCAPGGIASGTNLLVTMDISPGAGTNRYFKAYIDANNITCSTGSTGPSSAVSNSTAQSIIPVLFSPTNLSAMAVSYYRIDLSWADQPNETSYTLFRSTSPDTNAITFAPGFSSNIINYSDTNLAFNTKYYYWIKAYNQSGSSDFSETVSNQTLNVKPGGLEITLISKKSISLKWNKVKNVSAYTLFRHTSNNPDEATAISGFLPNIMNYVDKGLPLNTTYYYWIKAYSPFGPSAFSDAVWATTLAGGKPVGMQMDDALFDTSTGDIPEFGYILAEDQPIVIKGRIVDLAAGDIAYEGPERYMSTGEYRLIWEQADGARNGVYLIEFLIKKSNQPKFKVVARGRFIIVN